MAIEQVEAITGLAIFDNFLAFLLIGFVIILFLILMVYRCKRSPEFDPFFTKSLTKIDPPQ